MNCLIIGKVWPEPNSSAAGRRMLQLIDTMSQIATIHFATTANTTGFEEDLSQTKIVLHQIELNSNKVDSIFKSIDPEIVVFDRFMTEEQFSWRIMELFPKALRILNTEDLHFLRKSREVAIVKNQEIGFDNDDTFRELASIYRSDLTLLVSDVEVEFLATKFQVPLELLHYFPLYSTGVHAMNPSFLDRKDFVFIGNFLHSPNLDAVKQLKSEIWPAIFERDKSLELHIYGAYPPQHVLEMHNPKQGFFVHGRAEDQFDVLRNARVLIAPLRFGAGMKGKFLEAMECETPIITTSIGAESMTVNNEFSGKICVRLDEIVQQSLMLYHDKEKWSLANQHGNHILLEKYALDANQRMFLDRVRNLLQNVDQCREQHVVAKIIQHQSLLSNRYMSKWIMEKNRSNDDSDSETQS